MTLHLLRASLAPGTEVVLEQNKPEMSGSGGKRCSSYASSGRPNFAFTTVSALILHPKRRRFDISRLNRQHHPHIQLPRGLTRLGARCWGSSTLATPSGHKISRGLFPSLPASFTPSLRCPGRQGSPTNPNGQTRPVRAWNLESSNRGRNKWGRSQACSPGLTPLHFPGVSAPIPKGSVSPPLAGFSGIPPEIAEACTRRIRSIPSSKSSPTLSSSHLNPRSSVSSFWAEAEPAASGKAPAPRLQATCLTSPKVN